MPYLNKKSISQFVGTNCKRQLRLDLHPDNATYRPERQQYGMPAPQPPRPGLDTIKREGDAWEEAKMQDLKTAFGVGAIIEDANQSLQNPFYLQTALNWAGARNSTPLFILQATYNVGQAFKTALNINNYASTFGLTYGLMRPDVIELSAPGTFTHAVTTGGHKFALPSGDVRKQLRVIDVKLTAKPSQGYFTEVAYYMMALAGWLIDQNLEDQYVVVADGAIWPGSHEASNLAILSGEATAQGVVLAAADLHNALKQDLEVIPFEVFALTIRQFFNSDLPEVLSATDWTLLPWHVDNRCANCEYLGEHRYNRDGEPTFVDAHCMPTADNEDHLSRVAFVSRGARVNLEDHGVSTVDDLANLSASDPIFDTHQTLRATRTVIAGRAGSLSSSVSVIPPEAGTSAVMPRWPTLRVFLSADFDLGSAITAAFGLKAYWREDDPLGPTPQSQSWPSQDFPVDRKSLIDERRELLNLLRKIREILDFVTVKDRAHANTVGGSVVSSAVQFYVWDSLQFEHFVRVIGRHLPAILQDNALRSLAWLFPAEELLPNPTLSTRKSPVTIVRDVARSVLATPVVHYYSLLQVARTYHSSWMADQIAQWEAAARPAYEHPLYVHPLFEVQLSDQIPSERIHEIWGRVTNQYRTWSDQLGRYKRTVHKRLEALATVTRRLEADLRPSLSQTAPTISALHPPTRQNGLSDDGQLWYAFSKLNEALQSLEVHQIRAMPPHEREARFHSALLTHRLSGSTETAALATLGIGTTPTRRIYALSQGSREVKLRKGDFTFAISPANLGGFLDRSVKAFTQGTSLESIFDEDRYWNTPMDQITAVSIAGLDRNAGLIALDPSPRFPTLLDDLEAEGICNLTTDLVLDPVHADFFTPKLLAALKAIGNPDLAGNNLAVRRATGHNGTGARRTPRTPPAYFLWDAPAMASTQNSRDLTAVRSRISQPDIGLDLNSRQWQAWEAGLTRRLQIVWGPPGTGKSRTLRAISVGAALEAVLTRSPLRILITAFTYDAIDNVLKEVADRLHLLLGDDIHMARVRSHSAGANSELEHVVDLALNRHSPSSGVVELIQRLQQNDGITLVAATPGQVHNLILCGANSAIAPFFDLIILDEASQMNVANAVLPLCSLADGGRLVLAGDPKQLAPIHQAEPPKDQEARVGSIYRYYRDVHSIADIMLEENYRSNETIVAFAHQAGYGQALHSIHSGLRLDLLNPVPVVQPSGWPTSLPWSSNWATLLDPTRPAVAFVYPDGRSAQSNAFEADAVASLIYLLRDRLCNEPIGRSNLATGLMLPSTNALHTLPSFWKYGVGVVTPHRAQQGLIVDRLINVFGLAEAEDIRGAVDTVEKFQGRERNIIIASFALGDPDAIEGEEDFLMSLNRFNVMASRARAKLIVFVSREVVLHLANELDTMHESKLLKAYVTAFCNNAQSMTLPAPGGTVRVGEFRYRDAAVPLTQALNLRTA